MRLIKKGATDQTIYFDILDSASTTGGRKTGIAYNAASLIAYYTRAGAAAVQITLATQTAAGAHSDGGWVEVSATNAPGLYRLDLPDAVCTTGVDAVIVTVSGASGMVEASVEIQLSAVDVQTSTNMGLSALPTASPAASNGLPTVGTGSGQLNPTSGSSQFISNTGTATGGAVNSIALASGASSVNSFYTRMIVLILSGTGAGQARMISTYAGSTRNATVFTPFATAPDATSVYVVLPLGTDEAAYNAWEEGINSHTSGYTMGDTVRQLNTGTLIGDKVWGATTRTLSAGAITAATFAANALDAVWLVAARTLTAFGFTVATNSDSNVTAIKAKTDNLPASPAAVGSAMALTSGERATLTASIWDALTTGMTTVGSIGKKLSDATFSAGATAADVWNYLFSNSMTSGSLGEWFKNLSGYSGFTRVSLYLRQFNALGGAGEAGIYAKGGTAAHGIHGVGGNDSTLAGDGLHGDGGAATQGGSGVAGVAGAGNGSGIYGRATGNGSGVLGYGGAGAGADGLRGVGGVTSGDGMRLYPGGGNSNGLKAEHSGSGQDITAPVNDIGGGASAADVWSYAARTLTDKTGFELVAAYDAAKTAASAANLAIVDGIVDDILADSAALDLRLPASPSAVGSAMTLTSGERSTLADSIWDEVLSGHSGAGSAGLALSNAGGALDAAATAAAVWGALRATYSGAGTFGEYSRASLERVAGSATVDGLTLTAWFENILAHAAGDVVRSVNTYDYKKQDGVTTAFSFTSSAGGRS